MQFDSDEDTESAAATAHMEGEDEQEIALIPCYQMYVDAGYKAKRLIGSVKLDQPEGKIFHAAPLVLFLC